MTSDSSTTVVRSISAADTYALRHTVLWPHKPLAAVKLVDDAEGQHFGVYVGGELVSVISLFFSGDEARFRKFATGTAWQGKGIGSTLLRHTIDAAREAGARMIWCDARSSALSFYERFGMKAEGEVFYKGEVPYLVMRRSLV